MRLIITVEFDPGDVPEIRNRVTRVKGKIGEMIVEKVRDQMEENLWFTPEWNGYDPKTFRAAKVGRITTRLEEVIR